MFRKILRILLKTLLILSIPAVIAGCQLLQTIGDMPDQEATMRYERLPYYRDGYFRAAEELPFYPDRITGSGPKSWWRFLLANPNKPDLPLPLVTLTASPFAAPSSELAFYWLGHSSLIVELEGLRFLVDPVLGNAAPLPGVVRRYAEAPIRREDLPPIDYVLITHDHYDHLEYATIRALRERNETRFIAPYGVGMHLRKWGIPAERILEIGWGETTQAGNIGVISEETLHFSGRTFNRRNTTLWTAYVLKGQKYRLFISGDTGYGKHFKEIGARHGPFHLAFLEIDAWNPGWPKTHLFPEEVIRAYHDLDAQTLIPVHWGVFDLGRHPWDESIRLIHTLVKQDGNICLLTPKMGEKVIPGETPTTEWWNLADGNY
ncbi:MAG: MBL fold metallo-hydrolase [Zoogloeaceae bacterium]|jgi:L-ascorbate metabolism protein UlaG (beta-lactamase superfamily)|nr:MBL fold metallo-hydrolase [Zoogloeaceae bacterium]